MAGVIAPALSTDSCWWPSSHRSRSDSGCDVANAPPPCLCLLPKATYGWRVGEIELGGVGNKLAFLVGPRLFAAAGISTEAVLPARAMAILEAEV